MKVTVQISPSDYKRLSDEELVRRYAELREPEPLYHLFDRYGHIVYGMCAAQYPDAQAAQRRTEEMFTHMTHALLNGHIPNFKLWLLGYVQEHLDGKTSAPATPKKKDTADTDDTSLMTVYMNMPGMFDDAVMAAVDTLPEEQRKCIRLFYVDERNHDEIALATGLPVATVREHLRTGHDALKNDLKPFLFRSL